jgi:hypothetical protein
MTLKVTLVIDPEHGGELIALLAKAYSRGELGLGDIRIERAQPMDVGLRAIKQSVVAKEAPKPKAKKPRKGYGLGMRANKSGKPNGVVLTLTGLAQDKNRNGLREMFKAHGVNPNGISPLLSKLGKRGYVVMLGGGKYALSPKGAEFVRDWRERHASPNSD